MSYKKSPHKWSYDATGRTPSQQSFNILFVTNWKSKEIVPLKMASLKDARAVVQKGECTNWGRLPDFTQKTDKFGLGFTAEGQKAMRKAKTRRPPVLITNPGVNAVGEDNEVDEAEFNSWIYPTTDGGLTNWIAKDHTPVTFVTQ